MALPPYPGLDMAASGNGHAPSRAAQVRDGAFPESRYVSYAHMMLELTRSL